MRLVIATDERFDRTSDGVVWSAAQGHYGFWARYLDVFDEVLVVARVREEDAGRVRGVPATGDGVAFHPVPYYLGPEQYARQFMAVRRAVRAAIRPGDAVILRVLGQIANVMAPALLAGGMPYGVEVISDPHDMFAPGVVRHPLRAYFRWSYTRAQKKQVAHAAAASYVTRTALQDRYPVPAGTYATHASSVELPDAAFVDEPNVRPTATTLITVGSLAHMYKGFDVLLLALRKLHDRGLPLRLMVIGDGKYRPEVESLAQNLRLAGVVDLLGQVPSSVLVRDQFDQADLFVLASRTEGLPRAMIEAMARGLPAVGSSVGGIPELLSRDLMVPPGDPDALADVIQQFVESRQLRLEAAVRNLQKAREYHADLLAERRRAFWSEVRRLTASHGGDG